MTAATVVAVGCAAAAAGLLAGGTGRRRPAGVAPSASARRGGGRTALIGAGVAAALLGGTGSGAVVALSLIGAGVVGVALRLIGARRASREAELRRARVIELCDGLGAELAAGQTAASALERAAGDWPLVAPVARVAAAGGDVPSALRDLAAQPGAAALRVVAAAWQVAHRTGHGLADAIDRVADELRGAEQTRRVVLSELSSARATARLLAALPLVALAMGAGAGASPWRFLFGTPWGLVCLAGGLGLALAGLAWVEALARVEAS